MGYTGRNVLIVIENGAIQRDVRAQRECRALLEAGFGVSVVCPRNDETPLPEDLEAVKIHAYTPPSTGDSTLAFAWEYMYSLTAIGLKVLYVLRHESFDVIQVCNPPDVLFVVAAPLRFLGKRFVFDHHDPSPEVYRSRFGDHDDLIYRLLLILERLTFATASHIVTTNNSMRQIALTRGKRRPEEVTIVRNGPELTHLSHFEADDSLRRGRRLMCCWLGEMGPEDGVDLALQAIAHVVHDYDRRDCHFVFLGDGEVKNELEQQANALGIMPWVSFPGWVTRPVMHRYLASAHLGLAPDPKNERSDRSTMIKVMDYMAFALPIVSFDVIETRVSAGSSALYAREGDVEGFAELIERLLRSASLRADIGRIGRQRLEKGLAWEHQKDAYVRVFA
jgi:glycosyltransferase involved in cell wall biosynthesis